MESHRLILVPQARIHLRYQEWWPGEMVKHLRAHFGEIVVLGDQATRGAVEGSFSWSPAKACAYEAQQVQQYMEINKRDDDVLLHCDLSFPGIFHSVLNIVRPSRSVVICHATSLNHKDLFANEGSRKWHVERAHAELYNRVVVATKYHKDKLVTHGLGSDQVAVLGLPDPPREVGELLKRLPFSPKHITFASVARVHPQKVDIEVERVLKEQGHEVVRKEHASWQDYFLFLRQSRFLVITSCEETYGYQVIDALQAGCVPIAPRAYSYPELLPDRLLYDPAGSPKARALEILSIAALQKDQPCPRLLCQKRADTFWDNLAMELKG